MADIVMAKISIIPVVFTILWGKVLKNGEYIAVLIPVVRKSYWKIKNPIFLPAEDSLKMEYFFMYDSAIRIPNFIDQLESPELLFIRFSILN